MSIFLFRKKPRLRSFFRTIDFYHQNMEINIIFIICKWKFSGLNKKSTTDGFRCVESERQYDGARFHNHVCSDFSFEDHNPPTIKMILAFCQHVSAQLQDMADRTIVIHCKAGKVCFLSFAYWESRVRGKNLAALSVWFVDLWFDILRIYV